MRYSLWTRLGRQLEGTEGGLTAVVASSVSCVGDRGQLAVMPNWLTMALGGGRAGRWLTRSPSIWELGGGDMYIANHTDHTQPVQTLRPLCVWMHECVRACMCVCVMHVYMRACWRACVCVCM